MQKRFEGKVGIVAGGGKGILKIKRTGGSLRIS